MHDHEDLNIAACSSLVPVLGVQDGSQSFTGTIMIC